MKTWTIMISIVLTACLVTPVFGVEMEDGPAYLTDSHGASGVTQAFLELSEVAPEYDKYWKGSLDWLISVAKRDDQGHVYWYMSTTAPKDHPSHRISIPGTCGVIRMFLAGYERCGDQRYRETALAGTRTLLERFARRRQTQYGTAYALVALVSAERPLWRPVGGPFARPWKPDERVAGRV